MKILFITSRLPYPPYRGDKSRTFNFIKKLAEDHEITLISFYEKREERLYQPDLEKYCKSVNLIYLPRWVSWLKAALLYFNREPSQCYYYRSIRMGNMVAQVVKKTKFDLAYIHLFRMHWYSKYIPNDIYKVTDLTDVVSKEMFRSIGYGYGLKKYFIRREAVKIRNYERRVVTESDEIWVVSECEKNDLIQGSQTTKPVNVVGLGLNQINLSRNPEANTILFFGYSSTGHNQSALKYLRKNILPELEKRISNIKLNVFGAGEWSTKKNGIGEFPVNHFGFVENPEDIFSKNAVMVAPIVYSAGTQTKIIEAMNFGIPVITSEFGNEGIEAFHEKEIVICHSTQEYVEWLYRLLTDTRLNESLGLSGQKFVRNKFSWDNVTKRVSGIEKTLKSQNLKPNL